MLIRIWFGDLNPQEKRYSVALSKSRVVVKNAFGRLKGIFQCSSTRLDTSVQKTVSVTACCTSHNVCFKDWLQNSDTDVGENIPHPGDCCGFRLGQAMRELGQLHWKQCIINCYTKLKHYHWEVSTGRCLENSCPKILESNYEEIIKLWKIAIFHQQPLADIPRNNYSGKSGKIY